MFFLTPVPDSVQCTTIIFISYLSHKNSLFRDLKIGANNVSCPSIKSTTIKRRFASSWYCRITHKKIHADIFTVHLPGTETGHKEISKS